MPDTMYCTKAIPSCALLSNLMNLLRGWRPEVSIYALQLRNEAIKGNEKELEPPSSLHELYAPARY